ncbi:MAG TPA: glycosyltransferase family 4 protein, partial [Planctomycetota bacterium]|nr:glycosyltransferase family 4 protein [Planctomycetota bacterium]
DAFVRLKRSERFRDARLHLSGGVTGDDHSLWAALKKKFADEGVDRDVQVFDFDPPHRREFLASLSVLSVPTLTPVAFGTYVLEALASGVPVVLPNLGSFPELVEATGGGILYEPNDAVTLARSLGELLGDEDQRSRLGEQGRNSILKGFDLEAFAGRMLDVYRTVIASRGSLQPRSA